MNTTRARLVTVCLSLLLLGASLGFAAPPHKVLAAPGQLDANAPGVVLWHDYGSFALYKVSDAALDALPAAVRARVQVDPEMDTILFDRHPLTVTGGSPDLPARLASKPPAGAALHLVGFVGPIQQRWLDEVEATGARLVQYVANNAYLVWADAKSRSHLDALAAAGEFVQYSGTHQTAYKLGASIEQRILTEADPDELVPVVVQMYAHPGKAASQSVIAGLATEVMAGWSPILAFENIRITVRAGALLTIASLPDVVWVGEIFPRELMDEVQTQIMAGHLNSGQTGPSGTGYKAWLDGFGFSQNPADYPILSVADDGVGNGAIAAGAGDPTLTVLGAGTTSRIAMINNCTNDPLGDGREGHGHINTSIAIGYDQRDGFPFKDPNGYLRGQGVNPYGRSGNTKIFNNAGSYNISNCGGTDTGVIQREQQNGALISTNSWGCSGCAGTYDDSSQAYDVGVRDANLTVPGNQQMIYVFSAGNSGSSAGTIGTPGNGKNMITVGASENYRPSDEGGNWNDGCGVGPTGADNAMDIISFSSRGPAPGGRVKPEVIAPGTHIQGTASTASGYNGNSVCDMYRPSGQTVFAASSGTSHSTPAVAGLATLYYRWLQTTYGVSEPSPALMKAYMIAHPTYLTGVGAGGNLPTNSQGYGMPNMELAFDATPRSLLDQTHVFGNTGETWTWNGAVADPSKPVRIVMVYTDAAGAIGTSPQVNNLNLTAVLGANTYLGNRFTGQWSVTGGTADNANNYEAVFLPAGTIGPLQITVTAANIAGDGVPNQGDTTDQDFALVCYNCAQNPDFTLTATPASLEICAPANAVYTANIGSILGFTNPVTLTATGNPAGSTATFSTNPVTPAGTSTLTIGSTGAAAPGSYTITIGGTASGVDPKSYDVGLNLYNAAPAAVTLTSPADGALNVPATPTFVWDAVAQAATYEIEVATDATFTTIVASATGLTSPTWTANVALNTSTKHYWRVRAVNTCGTGTDSAVWSFTTVAAPGDCGPGTMPRIVLSDGFEAGAGSWTHNAAVGTDTWTISTANPHAGTQHFRGTNPSALSDQRLISPPIALPAGENPVVLKFWHLPNMENSGTSACFDGGILEVTTNGGATWTQVPNANLLVGPYTGAISTSFNNPLAGLQAWCGPTTQAYMYTIADVSAHAGQTVQFRWRIGSDSSVGRTGWDVDDVIVQSCQLLGGTDPDIYVSPAALASTQAPEVTTTQTLTVTNAGTPDLTWNVAEDPDTNCVSPADVPWLSVSPASGTTAGSSTSPVTVTFDSHGLGVGTFTANLCFTSNDPDPGPGQGTALVIVAVSLTVEVGPGECGPGTVPVLLVDESFEAGEGGWTHNATVGTDTWTISTANPHDGTQHFRGTNPAAYSDQRLTSPPIVLPAGQNPLTLEFWHVPNMENSGTSACFDGGILEVTADGGSTWTQVPNADLLVGPYVGAISSSFSNPLAGLQAWCGPTTQAYMHTIADVSAHAGQTVQFRWRIGSDSSVGRTGWDVDEVKVQSCMPTGTGDPNANVTPAALTASQLPNTTTSQTLNVGNTGTGALIWQIAEDPNTNCVSPADVPWLSASPLSGATAPAGNVPVTVTFDSTGIAVGTHTANLCVTSNDPDAGPGNGTNLVIVPVTLTVQQPQDPNIDVSPASLAATQAANTSTTQTLTIGNTGLTALTWSLLEEPASIVVVGESGAASHPVTPPAPGTDSSRGISLDSRPPLVYESPADFSEGFEDITNLPGWYMQNNSAPVGLTNWFQGNTDVFSAHAGAPTSYIGANFNNTAGAGTISNWLLTPQLNLSNGDTFSFWTRTADGSIWADRLQVRLSTAGASTNVGTSATDVGDFTELLLEINPTQVGTGYPQVWTQYTVTLSGLAPGASGRFALRYYVTDGGPSGNNSNYIGIDTVEYTSAASLICANPADVPWLSEVPASGTTAAGDSTPVTVTFDSTGLAVGTYNANLCITSNDPDPGPGNGTDLVVVPVELVVTDTPPVEHTVTAIVGTPSGTIVPPSQQVIDGSTATFTLTPAAGYEIDFVGGTCPAGTLAGNVYTTGAITADCEVIANFRPEAGPGPSVLEIPTLGPAGGALLGLILAGLGLGTLRRRRA